MNKIGIIMQREFFSRTRKKTFLITTILLPIFIVGFYAAIIYFSVKSDSLKHIAVLDESNLFDGKIDNSSSISFSLVQHVNPEEFKTSFASEGYDAFVHIPVISDLEKASGIIIYGQDQVGLGVEENIRNNINKAIEKILLQKTLGASVSIEEINSIKSNAGIRSVGLKGGQEKEGNAAIASAAALITGLLVYFVLMIYGSMVMRGVMEEKTNRIAEVMVSSVKPFQLMMGKIIGIGAVGLFQFLIWGILIVLLFMLMPVFFPAAFEQLANQSATDIKPASAMGQNVDMKAVLNNLEHINIGQLVSGFFVYFLGGYFMYAALFAAVGSAVNEDPQEAQQLMIPIMMPIIFSFVMLSKVIQDPHGSMAVFGSLFPLTSPILMPARLAFGVPPIQIVLSVLLLIGGFAATTWLAAKIYRTGILLYGKKITWKEMFKWIIRK